MVFVIEVLNPFEPENKRTTIFASGKKLSEYVDLNHNVVFVNGEIAQEDRIIDNDSQIIVIPDIQRGIGKDVLRAVSLIVLAAVAPQFVPAGWTGFAANAVKFAVIAGGAAVINAVMPPQPPSFTSDSSSIDTSNTYGWDTMRTLPRPGAPMPVLYGQMMLSGSVIGQYIQNEGDDEYYYVLLALCEGEIEPISIDDIKINDNPARSYDGIEFAYRTGTLDQDISSYPQTEFEKFHTGKVIDWFGKITTANSFTSDLAYDVPVEKDTLGNAVTSITLNVSCPKGLYSVTTNGSLDYQTVKFKAEYSSDGGATWTTYTYNMYGTEVLEYEWKAYNWDTWTYDYQWAQTQPPDLDGIYLYTKTGKKRVVTSTVSEVVDYFEIISNRAASVRRQFELEGLPAGSYRIRLTKLTEDQDSTTAQNSLSWNGMTEAVSERLYYPGIALLGLKLKATGQLSGSADVKVLTRRKEINVYRPDGTLYDTLPSESPAAVYWDILTNKKYGYGLPYDAIDFDKLIEFNDWCKQAAPDGKGGQEPRARFNGVFDFKTNVWEALQKVCSIGRAAPMIFGTKYSMIIDKPADPVQMFGMGNIVKDSFKVNYIGSNDIANEIEIDFKDETIDYESNTITVQIGDGGNKTSTGALGSVNQSQVYRNGKYMLETSARQRRVVSFEAGIDSIACNVGDVIMFSHDVPQWGYSGRVVSATTTEVMLDRKIDTVSTASYRIIIRHADDTIEIKDLQNPGDGQFDTFTVLNPFATAPQKYDTYQFGESGKEYLSLRVTSITRAKDHTRKIEAIDYVAYDDWTTPDDISRPSALTELAKIVDISIAEHLEKRKDGTIIPFIDFTWRVENGRSATVDIYMSTDGQNWDEVQTGIRGTSYRMNATSMAEGKAFTFAFATGDFRGKQSIKDAAKETYAYLGKSAPPADVTNFTYTITSNGVLLSWDKSPDIDLSGYKISLDGIEIEKEIKSTTYLHADLQIGVHTFEIWAIDTSGNYSENPNTLTIDMVAPVVTSLRSQVLDNTVLLFWDAQPGTVEIANYVIYKNGVLEGQKKGTFTSLFETEKGSYTYAVAAVDIFGNEGPQKSITTTVDAPPDYRLNADWYSDFSGTKVNTTVDNGTLVLPVNTTETWEEHFVNNGWASPQDQIDAGYPIYIEPFLGTASYEEIFDYGSILSSTRISVTVSSEAVQGSVSETCTISVSQDGTTWTNNVGTYQTYATDFRYVKIKLEWSGTDSAIKINSLNVKLDVKLRNDSGTANCLASDANGTFVSFNYDFIDVDAITATPAGTSSTTAVIEFNDVPNPTGFYIRLFDINGNRIDGQCYWQAKGY